MTSAFVAGALLVCGLVTDVSAQAGPPLGSPVGRGGQAPRAGAEGRLNEAQRMQMERRLQDRINQAVRERLRPTQLEVAPGREGAVVPAVMKHHPRVGGEREENVNHE